jgi:hypothetical protein
MLLVESVDFSSETLILSPESLNVLLHAAIDLGPFILLLGDLGVLLHQKATQLTLLITQYA